MPAPKPSRLQTSGRCGLRIKLRTCVCLVIDIAFGPTIVERWCFRTIQDQAFERLNVSGPLRSNNAEALLAAAIAGRGVVLFPTRLIDSGMLGRGQMVRWSDGQAA